MTTTKPPPTTSSSSTSAAGVGPPSLTFPRTTFQKLSPHPFLLAHLQPSAPQQGNAQEIRRPNTRTLAESRPIQVHKGSLTHASGSAVVRVGDTACVCGVRGELLYTRDIPGGYRAEAGVGELGLLVPNVELSTGCSPAHLPGQAPGGLAQRLTRRLLAVLCLSGIVGVGDLTVEYRAPRVEDEEMAEAGEAEDDGLGEVEIKAYWTLYIDVLFISLDGNPFDAAWAAVIAALESTKLPHAWWDADRSIVLCDDRVDLARGLQLKGCPVAWTGNVYSTGEAKWVLADPDTFEESVCRESVTVVVDCSLGEKMRIVRLEKEGGVAVGKGEMRDIVRLAKERWDGWSTAVLKRE